MGKKQGKGWFRVGQFKNVEDATKRQQSITAKGIDFNIQKGTKGLAWGSPKEVYRLWAREHSKK